MSTKKVVVMTMAALMIAGSCIAGQRNGEKKGRGKCDEKNRQEQIYKKRHHQRPRSGGIDRIINNEKLRKELGITDDQIERLKESKEELNDQRQKLIEKMKETRQKQMELMKADNLDRKAIMTAISQSGKIRTKLEKLRVKKLFRVQDILTDDQMAKVKERIQQHMRERRKEYEMRRSKDGKRKQNKNKDQSKPIAAPTR